MVKAEDLDGKRINNVDATITDVSVEYDLTDEMVQLTGKLNGIPFSTHWVDSTDDLTTLSYLFMSPAEKAKALRDQAEELALKRESLLKRAKELEPL